MPTHHNCSVLCLSAAGTALNVPLALSPQAEGPPLSDLPRLKLWLKERFARFNEAVERIVQAQAPWMIPDQPLRAAVKRVIKDDLLDPYQDFLLK